MTPNDYTDAKTWLCRPGRTGDACDIDLTTTVVATLLDRLLGPGEYRLRWLGHDRDGALAGPGVYWVRAVAGGRTDRERIVRL